MTCDVCGADISGKPFYRISDSDHPGASAVTCYRQRCGRKAFAIVEMRFARMNRREFEVQRMAKYVNA